jgi:hypothetical protein
MIWACPFCISAAAMLLAMIMIIMMRTKNVNSILLTVFETCMFEGSSA